MNKLAMDYTNRIIDNLYVDEQDELEMSHRLCLYYMIKVQLDFGAILLSQVIYESNFKVSMVMDHTKKLKEVGVIDETVMEGTYIYEVNLVAEETPCV